MLIYLPKMALFLLTAMGFLVLCANVASVLRCIPHRPDLIQQPSNCAKWDRCLPRGEAYGVVPSSSQVRTQTCLEQTFYCMSGQVFASTDLYGC